MPSNPLNTGNVAPNSATQSANDRGLIEHAKARDEHAFLELLKRYAYIVLSMIRRYIHRILGYEEEDIMQEIHAKAYEILPRFRGDEVSFQVWLRRSTQGICLNLLEKQRRQETVSLDALCTETLEQSLPTSFSAPDIELRHKEIRDTVHEALEKLPETLRRVVILKDLEGIGYEEIARILGIEVGTVKSRLHRGRTFLRHELQAVR